MMGAPLSTRTHNGRDKQGTGQGGLNVLDLVRCSVKTKACSNTALGAFLCEGNQGRQPACSPRASPGCRLQSKQSVRL